RQGSSRVKQSRSADREKNIRADGGVHCPLHRSFRKRFFEPDHVWPQPTPALRTFGRNLARILPALDQFVFVKTLSLGDVPVQFDNLATSSASVEAIHVLGDEVEFWEKALHFSKSPVCRVGLGLFD